MTFAEWVAHLSFWDAALGTILVVVTWGSKKVLDWLWSVIRASIAAHGFRGTLAAVFNRENASVLYDLMSMALFAFLFFRNVFSDAPATGRDVATMIGCTIMFLLYALYLPFDVVKAIRRNAKNGKTP